MPRLGTHRSAEPTHLGNTGQYNRRYIDDNLYILPCALLSPLHQVVSRVMVTAASVIGFHQLQRAFETAIGPRARPGLQPSLGLLSLCVSPLLSARRYNVTVDQGDVTGELAGRPLTLSHDKLDPRGHCM